MIIVALVLRTTLPELEYLSPRSVEELLELKARYRDRAALLAGGTVLLTLMRLGFKFEYVIDLKRVKELSSIDYVEGKGVVIGAAATLRDLERSDVIKSKYRVLWDAVRQIGDHHLRSRATIGGNLCNPSLQADTIAPLMVLDAVVEISSVRGARRTPISELFSNPGGVSLEPDEVVTKIYIPEPPRGSTGSYFKVWWILGIAVLVSNPGDPRERVVRIAYTSAAPTPLAIKEVEKIFRQDRPLGELIKEALSVIKARVNPPSDSRASREYREHLIEFGTALLLRKLLIEGGDA